MTFLAPMCTYIERPQFTFKIALKTWRLFSHIIIITLHTDENRSCPTVWHWNNMSVNLRKESYFEYNITAVMKYCTVVVRWSFHWNQEDKEIRRCYGKMLNFYFYLFFYVYAPWIDCTMQDSPNVFFHKIQARNARIYLSKVPPTEWF